ncbi:MAG: gamma-glutamyl-phosphate reductase [Thermosynechococcaceae cyanobacterium]
MNDVQSLNLQEWVDQAHRESARLAQTPIQVRNGALKQLAIALQEQQDTLLEANTLDLETTRDLAITGLGLQWLKLTPERLSLVRQFIELLMGLPDPLQIRQGTVSPLVYSLDGSRILPQGVVCGLYEFLPEFPVLLAGLCFKTGNSLILKGNPETSHSHQRMTQMISTAIAKVGLNPDCFLSCPSDRSVSPKDLLGSPLPIDLVVPYGRPSFIQDMVRLSTGPTLRPVMGNGYLIWSPSGSSDLVRALLIDSHLGNPDAVNAIEKVILTPDQNVSLLNVLFSHLREKGFALKGDEILVESFPDLGLAEPEEWSCPYLNKTIAFKRVNSLAEGIQWMNRHSSGQANVLVSDTYREVQQFTMGATCATAFINASPRFSRLTSGPRGMIALGMQGRGSHCPGPIGIEHFLKRIQIVQGIGPI